MRLIEKLELKQLSGVNYRPKSSAANKANFKKVFDVLRTKNEMNLKYIYDEDPILESKNEAILEFLEHIKHVYRHTAKYVINRKKE